MTYAFINTLLIWLSMLKVLWWHLIQEAQLAWQIRNTKLQIAYSYPSLCKCSVQESLSVNIDRACFLNFVFCMNSIHIILLYNQTTVKSVLDVYFSIQCYLNRMNDTNMIYEEWCKYFNRLISTSGASQYCNVDTGFLILQVLHWKASNLKIYLQIYFLIRFLHTLHLTSQHQWNLQSHFSST